MTSKPTPKRGRRAGNPDTKGQIVNAAWTLFLRDGFTGTSLRAIAREAECDAALVHHYYRSKEQLFFDAMRVSFDADKAIEYLTSPELIGIGRRLFTILTAVYESPRGAQLVELLSGDAQTRELFVRTISGRVECVAEELLPIGRSRQRRVIVQVEAILAGFITTRYVLGLEPAVSLTRDEAIANFGDLVQQVVEQELAKRTSH